MTDGPQESSGTSAPAAPAAHVFAPGDRAQFKATGRIMTVEKVEEDLISCTWDDGEVGGHGLYFAEELEHVPHADNVGGETSAPDLPTPSEVLFAFAAWLTTRDEIAGPFSRIHEAGQAAVLVGRFCSSQGYAAPRDDFTSRFKPYPQD